MERKVISTAGAALAVVTAAMQGVASASEAFGRTIEESTPFRKKPRTRVRLKGSKPRHVDFAGMPHNCSGDKLARKAMTGTVGLQGSRKGFLDNWSSTKVGSMGLGDRRRAKG